MLTSLKNKINQMFDKSLNIHYNITNMGFILVIFLASIVSLFHVQGFWLITNNYFWATALAVATGLGIIVSMMAIRYTMWTYISFILIILIELVGNIFHAFMNIDVESDGFIAFKELTKPIFDFIYLTDDIQIIPDIVYMRYIATIEGAFIPILVGIMFHMWMKVRDSFIIENSAQLEQKTVATDISTQLDNNNTQKPILNAADIEELPKLAANIDSLDSVTFDAIPIISGNTINSIDVSGSTIDVSGSTIDVSGSTIDSSVEILEPIDKKKVQTNLSNRIKSWFQKKKTNSIK